MTKLKQFLTGLLIAIIVSGCSSSPLNGPDTSTLNEGDDNPKMSFSPAIPKPCPAVEIGFQLPYATHVRLTVLNCTGYHVRTLVNGVLPAGSHDVSWDKADSDGEKVTEGIYIYELIADFGTQRVIRWITWK
jgi:hypothetical protein